MNNKFKNILLIDDDESLNKVLHFQLSQMGFNVTTVVHGNEGIKLFRQGAYNVVITDLQLPDINGIDVLKTIRNLDNQVIIIIITAYGSVENAIEAVKLGADDYLTKPFGKETLRFVIEKAVKLRSLEEENIQLKGELFEKYDFGKIVAKSSTMEDVLKLTGRVAESDATILIRGESGTGKELIARAIHYNSPRKEKPLITVNCPSIPENLMESEMFGHIKGAFTGALKDRKGKFEMADQSTIFLDEIGDLKPDLQARLLRVLQEKEIERIGDSKPTAVDVRVVAATNRDLEDLVNAGMFREDLYYRLNVVNIRIPPLRDRKEDIPFLVDAFIKNYAKDKPVTITNEAVKMLMKYDWPGNVRELQNIIERTVVLQKEGQITPELLPPLKTEIGRNEDNASNRERREDLSLDEIERQAIIHALEKSSGNQTHAARLLDIPRHVLIYRMKKLGLNK